jgi:C4-dicarboxylate-specific signal transduction histidine kinase
MWRSREAYWQGSWSRRWQIAAAVWPASQGYRVARLNTSRTLDKIRRSTVAISKPAANQAPNRYHHIALPSGAGTRGEFLGVFAHELAQPLSSILRNAEASLQIALLETTVPLEIRETLHAIITDAVRAAEMIQRLRSLLTRGEVQCQRVDLNQVVRDVLALQQSELSLHKVSAAAELAEQNPFVLGDRIQLQQVLLNLVTNACEAMANQPHRERRLIIATRLEDDGENVECSVTDAGHGIPPSSLERIFEPRVTTKGNGLGLGLSICRSIIEAHRGRVWAENASAGGAVFRFTARRVP